MNKSKGFTLIELLSILVIMGILTTIGVVGYSKYIDMTDEAYYENLSKTFKSAVIEYSSDNERILPKNVGDIKEVTSTVLINKNYLENLYNSKEKNCEGIGVIIKNSTTSFDYKTCLKCPSYNDNDWYGDGCTLIGK